MPKELSGSFPNSEAAGWLGITQEERFSFACAYGPPQLPMQRRIPAEKPERELAQMQRIASNLHVCIYCLKTHAHTCLFVPLLKFSKVLSVLKCTSYDVKDKNVSVLLVPVYC